MNRCSCCHRMNSPKSCPRLLPWSCAEQVAFSRIRRPLRRCRPLCSSLASCPWLSAADSRRGPTAALRNRSRPVREGNRGGRSSLLRWRNPHQLPPWSHPTIPDLPCDSSVIVPCRPASLALPFCFLETRRKSVGHRRRPQERAWFRGSTYLMRPLYRAFPDLTKKQTQADNHQQHQSPARRHDRLKRLRPWMSRLQPLRRHLPSKSWLPRLGLCPSSAANLSFFVSSVRYSRSHLRLQSYQPRELTFRPSCLRDPNLR
mmetsp:Transcript_1392/g.3232  ORF Transcript_1392/g.3232 Transcript_1392/m.3232 type:complete len:259 (+) Transcript_1392:3228-4004(+)